MDSVTRMWRTKIKEPLCPLDKKDYAEKMMTAMDCHRAQKGYCDFTIKVGNESFPVHRLILASACNYFDESVKV